MFKNPPDTALTFFQPKRSVSPERALCHRPQINTADLSLGALQEMQVFIKTLERLAVEWDKQLSQECSKFKQDLTNSNDELRQLLLLKALTTRLNNSYLELTACSGALVDQTQGVKKPYQQIVNKFNGDLLLKQSAVYHQCEKLIKESQAALSPKSVTYSHSPLNSPARRAFR